MLNKLAQIVSNAFCNYNMYMEKINGELYTTTTNTILIDDLAYVIIPHINDNLFIISEFPVLEKYFDEKITDNSKTMIQLVFDMMITNCKDTIENNINKFFETYMLYHDIDFMELFINGKWYDKEQHNRPLFKILQKANIFIEIFEKLNSTMTIKLNDTKENIIIRDIVCNRLYNIIKTKYIGNFIINIKKLTKERAKKRLNEDLILFNDFSQNKYVSFDKYLGAISTCIKIFINDITIDKILALTQESNFDREICQKIITLKKDITPTLQKQLLDVMMYVPSSVVSVLK
jgi:hypothetical protein